LKEEKEIRKMLADMIWLNGLIATELIQITENTSASLRGEVPEKCKVEHKMLKERALSIISKYSQLGGLDEHVLKHSLKD